MRKSATIHVRVDEEFKSNLEKLLRPLGMTITEAVNICLHQIVLNDGLPFDVRMPRYNSETLAAIEEVEKMTPENSKVYNDAEELFKELDSEC